VPTPLNKKICFTLYATSMAINRSHKPMLDAVGVTYPQYLVISALGEDGGMTIGAVAARLMLESSTVTPTVKRLEKAGLVTRQRSLTDERQVLVTLTDAGRALLAQTECLGETLIARSGMTPEQLQALNREIQVFHEAVSRHTD
jgi:DNA-binding MarR family transcriptional regulator